LKELVITLHITGAGFVLGMLFFMSLLSLTAWTRWPEGHMQEVRAMLYRLKKTVFYPLSGLTIAAGAYTAWATNAFNHGTWLPLKLLSVVFLFGLAGMLGRFYRTGKGTREKLRAVLILIVIFSLITVFLSEIKPI